MKNSRKKSEIYQFLGIGPECEHKWNPNGSGILWNDYPFPIIFYRNMTVVQNLKDYYEKYNADGTYPLVQYQENAPKIQLAIRVSFRLAKFRVIFRVKFRFRFWDRFKVKGCTPVPANPS